MGDTAVFAKMVAKPHRRDQLLATLEPLVRPAIEGRAGLRDLRSSSIGRQRMRASWQLHTSGNAGRPKGAMLTHLQPDHGAPQHIDGRRRRGRSRQVLTRQLRDQFADDVQQGGVELLLVLGGGVEQEPGLGEGRSVIAGRAPRHEAHRVRRSAEPRPIGVDTEHGGTGTTCAAASTSITFHCRRRPYVGNIAGPVGASRTTIRPTDDPRRSTSNVSLDQAPARPGRRRPPRAPPLRTSVTSASDRPSRGCSRSRRSCRPRHGTPRCRSTRTGDRRVGCYARSS
jgi:hypothetical protein